MLKLVLSLFGDCYFEIYTGIVGLFSSFHFMG